jgi:hypothetical protein
MAGREHHYLFDVKTVVYCTSCEVNFRYRRSSISHGTFLCSNDLFILLVYFLCQVKRENY